MHSANTLTGCTKSSALIPSVAHRNVSLDGIARSAMGVFRSGRAFLDLLATERKGKPSAWSKEKQQKADPRESTRMNSPDDLQSARLCCGWGFSALFRSARASGNACRGRRAAAYILVTERVRGKAAPRRLSGALLFRPFSWAKARKRAGERGTLWVWVSI